MSNSHSAPTSSGLNVRGFARDARPMIIGVGLAQAMSLLALPFITRLFEPRAIGLHALFLAVGGSLTVIGSLRLDLALVLPAAEWRAMRLFATIFYQAVLLTGILAVINVIFSETIRHLLTPDIVSASWLWLLMPFVIASSLQLAGNGLATRRGLFSLIAISNFVLSATYAVGAVLVGFLKPSDTGLIWVRVLAQVGCTGLLLGLARFGVGRALLRPSLKLSARAWRQNHQFLIFNTPYSLISGIARDIPLYGLAAFGGASLGAAYALARTVVMAPTTLLSGALSSVFFRSAVRSFGTSSLERLAMRLTIFGLAGSAASFAFILTWGDNLFSLALGDQWRLAGQFAQALAIPLWLALQNGWPERLFEVARKQQVSFTLQIGFDLLHMTVVFAVFLATKDALATIAAYAVSYTAYQIAYRVAVYRVASFRLASLGRSFGVGLAVFAGSALIFYATRLLLGGGWAGCVLCASSAVAVTAVGMIIFSKKEHREPRGEVASTVTKVMDEGNTEK